MTGNSMVESNTDELRLIKTVENRRKSAILSCRYMGMEGQA